MGFTKTHLFSEEINSWSNIFKALGHPGRLAIVQHLIQKNACMCNDIIDEIKLAQPTISRHLRVLKEAGIIKGSISGPHICYCIDPETMKKTEQFLQLQNKNIRTSECC